MTFHSFDYLAFFGLVVAFYWCLPHRAQNVLLLAGSYVFYGYVHPWFLIPIAFSTLVDYYGRHRDGAGSDAQEALVRREPRDEPRAARLLQVLQLLRRERRAPC